MICAWTGVKSFKFAKSRELQIRDRSLSDNDVSEVVTPEVRYDAFNAEGLSSPTRGSLGLVFSNRWTCLHV